MNSKNLIVKSLVALGTLGLIFSCRQAIANEANNTSTDLPVDDQVRFIGELESKNIDDWSFNTNENSFGENAYQLQLSQPDVRLVEQDRSTWGNDGRGRNYSVLVDVYKSDEEQMSNE